MSKSRQSRNRRRRRMQKRDQSRLRLHQFYMYRGAKVRVECAVDETGQVIVRHTSNRCEIVRAQHVQDIPVQNEDAA